MPYVHTYQVKYKTNLGETIQIDLFKLDGLAPSVEQLKGVFPCLRLEWSGNGNNGKYDSILSMTATVNIWADQGSTIHHLTFIASNYEEWMMIAYQDGVEVFKGFLIPERGGVALKDKPFQITIRATDGLGLLKNKPLSDVSGNPFSGRNSLISYISGALHKTGTFLDVKVYCNIYEETMLDRSDADHWDMTQQAKLHHRTFLSDSGSFVSCYEALEIILGKHFRLYYEAGKWVIYRIPEYAQVSNVWFTEYNGGIPQFGQLEDTTAVPVGKSRLIRPINADAILSNEIALKSAKHIFNFVFPENRVNNERLSQLGSLISSDATGEYYNVVGWNSMKGVLVSMTPSSVVPMIRVERNTFGIETDRYYVIPHDPTANAFPLDNFIINANDDFWVKKGDRLSVFVETRMKNGQTPPPDTHECLLVAILQDGTSGGSISHWYTLNPNGTWTPTGANLNIDISGSVDETQWVSVGAGEEGIIPVDGRVYIWLATGGVDDGNEAWFRNLRINYTMVLGNGNVKGDYWLRSKNSGQIDTTEDEVFISDALRKLMKGAIWRESGEALTEYKWYRFGTSEERHYKELLNMGFFAHYYRRYLSIEGTFKGLKSDDGFTQIPLSLSKRYYFEDAAAVQSNFILIPPLSMDMDRGWFSGRFIEVRKDDADVTEEGDSATFNYIF